MPTGPSAPTTGSLLPKFVSDWILSAEGGFGNDPDDAGGATKFGISQRAYPDLDIAKLTIDRALEIYARDYWTPIRGSELPPAIALMLFDGAVNMGVQSAVMRFQLALAKLGVGDVTADGIVGPRTIHAARVAAETLTGVEAALAEALSYRATFYHELVMRRPVQTKFLRGWLKRTYLLMGACLGING